MTDDRRADSPDLDDSSAEAQLEAAGRKIQELQVALHTSRHIGMAMGMLMERHSLPPDKAFLVLQHMSQRRNVKLREIAEMVIYTVEAESHR